MGHLRRLMKELYEAGFCFKECIGLVDNFRITTSHFSARALLLCVPLGMGDLCFLFLLFVGVKWLRSFMSGSTNFGDGHFCSGESFLLVEISRGIDKNGASQIFKYRTSCLSDI